MNKTLAIVAASLLVFLGAFCTARQARTSAREISLADLRDKIEGGWAGQMIGVSYGAPTEFRHLEQILAPEDLIEWNDDTVKNALQQDDLYVDMTFAKVLDDKGLDATTEDFGAMFKDAKYRLWHANLAARRALKRGVPAALSGTPKYNSHANDIDFQIESDFIGLMAPGLPKASNDICWRAGRVMNHGDGIYGGMFISGMYAAAFFEKDPRKIVEAGLATLPPESPYAKVISDMLKWSAENPGDWIHTWNLVEDKWNGREPCPAGALLPFNIDAKLNGAYVAMGLLYGEGDFTKTMTISTRCGQDSDCNPSSAAGVLGVVLGYKNLPDKFKGGIDAIADEKFDYTDYSFHTIVDSTLKRAVALVEKNGGRVDGDTVVIPMQPAEPAELEMWDDYGSPVERVSVDDARWSWQGKWDSQSSERRGGHQVSKTSSSKGAEASIQFEGTGAILVGPYLPAGGQAEVYLDGELDRTIDVYPDEDSIKGDESVWHAFGLKPGQHTVRLVVRGEPYGDSKGSDITLNSLVVFR
jgi:ADP-ribosylglycohydrolase